MEIGESVVPSPLLLLLQGRSSTCQYLQMKLLNLLNMFSVRAVLGATIQCLVLFVSLTKHTNSSCCL